jgi:hypothetical protein
MRPDEILIAIDWAAAEGWNPGRADAVCFATADPDGFPRLDLGVLRATAPHLNPWWGRRRSSSERASRLQSHLEVNIIGKCCLLSAALRVADYGKKNIAGHQAHAITPMKATSRIAPAKPGLVIACRVSLSMMLSPQVRRWPTPETTLFEE